MDIYGKKKKGNWFKNSCLDLSSVNRDNNLVVNNVCLMSENIYIGNATQYKELALCTFTHAPVRRERLSVARWCWIIWWQRRSSWMRRLGMTGRTWGAGQKSSVLGFGVFHPMQMLLHPSPYNTALPLFPLLSTGLALNTTFDSYLKL